MELCVWKMKLHLCGGPKMPDKSHHNILEEDSGEIQEVFILYFTFCNSCHSNRPVRNLGHTEGYLLSNFIHPTQLPESKAWEHTTNIAWHTARAGPGSAEPNVVNNALFLPGCFSPSLHRWRADLRTGGCCSIPHCALTITMHAAGGQLASHGLIVRWQCVCAAKAITLPSSPTYANTETSKVLKPVW